MITSNMQERAREGRQERAREGKRGQAREGEREREGGRFWVRV